MIIISQAEFSMLGM